MNKTPRLSKSGIDYLDLAWNFYSGCWNWSTGVCPLGTNCWAMKITQRFKQHYPNGFEPTFYPEAFLSPLYVRKPSRIGVAFMGDLFLEENEPNRLVLKRMTHPLSSQHEYREVKLRDAIFWTVNACPQHTFIFLTKCPWNLAKWNSWPENAWVGATVTADGDMTLAITNLANVEARVRFVSFEPLLGAITMRSHRIKGILDWVIIGAQTNPYRSPKKEWVEEIIEAADRAGIPVFIKDNLRWPEKRQEFPK